jgi:hypothetical protein
MKNLLRLGLCVCFYLVVSPAVASDAVQRNEILQRYATRELAPPPTPPKVEFQRFIMTSLARLLLKQDLAAVSANILREDFQPWLTGTDIAIAGSLCKRVGDYDFIMMGMLHMAYADEEAGQTLLTPEARHKLRHVLLYEKGNKHHIKFTLGNCLPIKIKDTENHILMTETARYLTNQLLFKEALKASTPTDEYDNEKNGFEDWFLEHLSEFLRLDFDELNSRPYQGYTLIALATLHTYAEGPRVKLMTRMILDYLSAKTAIQTMGLRRHTPFRRRLENLVPKNFLQADSAMSWYLFHVGNNRVYDGAEASEVDDYLYLMAAVQRYEMPAQIRDIFHGVQRPMFQTIHGRDPEAYYLSPSFLLTAGGRHRHVFGYFTKENSVLAVPTTIIGRSEGTNPKEVFSLRGPEKWSKRNNLCVAPNFACGSHLSIPESARATGEAIGPWSFYRTKDFQIAVYQRDELAFWEVQEPGNYDAFKQSILSNNKSDFLRKGANTYVTSAGRRIEFDWSQKNLSVNPILSIDGVKTIAKFKDWPLAEGDLIQSAGDGFIRITPPGSVQSLVLDGRDVHHPKRLED